MAEVTVSFKSGSHQPKLHLAAGRVGGVDLNFNRLKGKADDVKSGKRRLTWTAIGVPTTKYSLELSGAKWKSKAKISGLIVPQSGTDRGIVYVEVE